MSRKASSWEGEPLAALKQRWDRPDVHLYARLDSTSDRAKELAEEGAPSGAIVLADEQTAGRGLTTRRWYSPRGAGVYLSLVLRPARAENPLLIPLLAGLALARAIERLLAQLRVALKWPNDVIIDDRKVAGVLSESAGAGGMPDYFVIGVGVNVHQGREDFPASLRDVATSLDQASGRTVSRLVLADLIIAELEECCAEPPASLDGGFLREFDERDWLRDRRCSVEAAETKPLRGTAVGIAPDGALLFRPDRGPLARITSGRIRVPDLSLPDY